MGADPAQAYLQVYQAKLFISGATPKSKSLLTSALLSLCIHYNTRLSSCQVFFKENCGFHSA